MKQKIAFINWIGILWSLALYAAPTHLVDEPAVEISEPEPGIYLVDFGRVSFANIRLMPPSYVSGEVVVHFGEAFADGRINRKPPGTVRYSQATVSLNGANAVVTAPPADARNTKNTNGRHPPAVRTPSEWGVVMPFRWVEIEGWKGEFLAEHLVRQSAFASSWDDEAASFESSDKMLNRIWKLCHYSIKATTFAGVYVDGDRERIPYEADAYLNQISHYYTDSDKQVARDTYDHLMTYPTWPTEWESHMVFMAYADWMHTGDREWLEPRYDALKGKLLMERVGEDGLVSSSKRQIKRGDIVDWPRGERDGYAFTKRNTVVNAFHLQTLAMMQSMSESLGRTEDAADYAKQLEERRATFHKTFFDAESGLYRDGVGTKHSSIHANFFPLAFGLVPESQRAPIVEWLGQRGMRCSVYAAQYLMEALFMYGADEVANQLILAGNDRSWRHMVESGTTISWEAWDQKYKPNQDWNHAWGAAPANLFPRYLLGAEPLTPGWETVRIRPIIGGLDFARGKVPTIRGPILIDWKAGKTFSISLTLPKGMPAQVELPAVEGSIGVFKDGKPVSAVRVGKRWILDALVEGRLVLEVR